MGEKWERKRTRREEKNSAISREKGGGEGNDKKSEGLIAWAMKEQ